MGYNLNCTIAIYDLQQLSPSNMEILAIRIVTAILTVHSVVMCCSHASQLNYVKPYKNITCPGNPCMTFEEYIEAAETYLVSNTQFTFLPGDHYYDGNLRLSNIINMSFQGQDLISAGHAAQIVFTPGSNLTFNTSYNIVLAKFSILLSGSQIHCDDIFVSIQFRNTSAQVLNLSVTGSKSSLASTAFFCRDSHLEMASIQITGAKSLTGAALIVLYSIVTFSGSNNFNDNVAYITGGAVYSLDSIITLSGVNHFESNRARFSGGAIASVSNSVLNISGSALFLRNRAENGNAGAMEIDESTLLLESNGILHFRENFALLMGGATIVTMSNAQIKGQMIVQQNTAIAGSFAAVEFSNVTCVGKALYINNSADQGGAISITLSSWMNLSSSKFENNHARFNGGALYITNNSKVIIQDSLMMNNSAGSIGGAIDVVSGLLEFSGENYIENNKAAYSSGGVNAFLMSRIIFTGNVYFVNNTAITGGAFSTSLTNTSVQGTLFFVNNSGYQGGAMYGQSSKIEFDTYARTIFESNRAMERGGAIYSVDDSMWSIKGSLIFLNNVATLGGAMSLVGSSKLILSKNSDVVFSQNHANTNGGAIYFADRISINQCRVYENTTVALCFKPNTTMMEVCKRLDDCFIELDADFPFDYSSSNISLMFLDNYAGKSGAAFYGGSFDNCRLYLGGGFQDDCGNKIGREYTENPLPIILQISKIGNTSSAISSEPFRVCFCDRNGVPDCEMNVALDEIRGKQFTLSAVTVGQGNFTVPSSIKADFGNNTSTTLNRLQRVQDTGNTCTNISYRLFSAEDSVTMVLFPDGPCRDTGIARREVKVTFLPCPDGFILVDTECMCDERLTAFNASCDVDSGKIRRQGNSFWVMAIYDNFSYQGLVLHNDRCPFDFCVETTVEINLEDPDIQCNHNHSGILCGSCRTNFSLTFGSLQCHSCSHAHLTLILVFALAGIALVVLLLLLQLTVAHGTINGLVFYANIVQVNRDIFFPPGFNNVLTVFIAWLNLDLGIETCFYDGMNAYGFIWLQFVFPFYVWFLIGFIIFISRYSVRISRWLGDNPVSVLATLFLLSYSKILRTIIAVLSRTTLEYPDGTDQYVWLYDGSVPYFQRVDHILMGVFAISALCFLFLPYTILLLTGHWLQAYSHWKIFSWLNKLKPFMDTYHGPFKRESRYWTGFLLLARCAMFLTFAFNALGNVSINLLTIISVTVGIMALAWLKNRLYNEIHNDILEACFILNLCIFAAATYHIRETKERQDKLAYTSAGIAFVLFICILLYHIFRHISKTKAWKMLPTKCDYDKIREIIHDLKSKAKSNGQRDGSDAEAPQTPMIPVTIVELDDPMMGEYTA